MPKVEILPATRELAEVVIGDVRAADVDEFWAASYSTPQEVMDKGLRHSDFAYAGLVDDVPLLIWGVNGVSMIGRVGIPWMIGSSGLDAHSITFLRQCHGQVMRCLTPYDRLENYVDSRNKRAIMWLRWLGFTIGEAEPYGVMGKPFHKFWMVK